VLGIAGLYAAVLAVGIALAFERPAGAAILPSLVPRPLFPSAVTVSSLVRAAAFASGPALCGFVIGWAGIGWVYATHALLLVCSLALLAFVRARPIEEPGRRRVDLQAIREGLSFLRRRRAVLGAMTLDMLAVILGGVQVLLPIYASDILEVGPRGYGLLSSSLELGQLLTSVALVLLPPIERVGRALLLSVAGYGLATIAFGLSRSFPLSIAAYMAVGMADQVSVVARTTLIQLATPDALRGRVNAVNLVFIGASNQLGAVEAGFVAALTTAPFAVVSGGVGCLLALLAVIRVAPELGRHVESSGDAGEA
jgi:MFS family permease